MSYLFNNLFHGIAMVVSAILIERLDYISTFKIFAAISFLAGLFYAQTYTDVYHKLEKKTSHALHEHHFLLFHDNPQFHHHLHKHKKPSKNPNR
jgi:hypothetical protein